MSISGVTSSSGFYASTPNPSRRGLAGGADESQRSPEELKQIQKLKEIDRKVRQHEQAHMAAGAGMITSGASYSYQKGPDGVNYAVAGEVGIDTSPGRTPDETIQRAQKIRAAALAPADPSGQDRAVAAKATQMEQQARIEKAQQSEEESREPRSGLADKIGKAYSAGSAERTPYSVYA